MLTDYVPVACSFHDRLEHFAIRKTPCSIQVSDAAGRRTLDGIITDIVTADGAEFLLLRGAHEETHERIRLDAIVDVQATE